MTSPHLVLQPLSQRGSYSALALVPLSVRHMAIPAWNDGWRIFPEDGSRLIRTYIGKPTPVVPLDLSAAYALSWCLTDCWSVLTADHLEESRCATAGHVYTRRSRMD